MRAPLLFDPTSGVIPHRDTRDTTKLSQLGAEGRSTATSISSYAILTRMAGQHFPVRDQKLLSFTDNRQDAALQSGHFNDFMDVVRVRAAIWRAVASSEEGLRAKDIGRAVREQFGLGFLDFANLREELPSSRARATSRPQAGRRDSQPSTASRSRASASLSAWLEPRFDRDAVLDVRRARRPGYRSGPGQDRRRYCRRQASGSYRYPADGGWLSTEMSRVAEVRPCGSVREGSCQDLGDDSLHAQDDWQHGRRQRLREDAVGADKTYDQVYISNYAPAQRARRAGAHRGRRRRQRCSARASTPCASGSIPSASPCSA